MADASQGLNYTINSINALIHGAGLVPKTMDETMKMIDTIWKNALASDHDNKAAKIIRERVGAGEKLYCLMTDNNSNGDNIKRSLVRQGISHIETTINGKKAFLYSSGDFEKVNGIFHENQEASKQMPFEEIALSQCNKQKTLEKDIQMLKDILDDNKIPYSIKGNEVMYPKKYEDKVKIANDVVAFQKQFPEVTDYAEKRYENCLSNVNEFNNMCKLDQFSGLKDTGFFDKDGTGVLFAANHVLVIEKENDKYVYKILNRSEFPETEEYANLLNKIAQNPHMMKASIEGLSDKIKKDGLTEDIVNNIKEVHKRESLERFSLSKAEEDRLKEISKMTQVFIIDEHPGGYKEMKLARCMFSSQAVVSSYKEPDPDGPMDNKVPQEIKENAKEESEKVETHTMTKEEIETVELEEKIFEESIVRDESVVTELSVELSTSEENLEVGDK